ncbi:unnamed protein product, partial [Rotaria sp. Silwood1]
FSSKDVVSYRTEFTQLDSALVLAQLSYNYSGLNEEETDPASIYDQWILYEDEKYVPKSIKQWNKVNLKDYQQQFDYVFPTFRHNMLVINYFLDYFVFLRSKIITEFIETNDTQLLLPIHIRQYDLPELQKTDTIVLNNLLKSENENFQILPINVTSENILKQIVDYQEIVNVILDIGALFIDGTNRDIAIKWLKLSDKNTIDYVVYFDSDSIVACDRQLHHYSFVTFPASERLDCCIFYLDEIHTRGTGLTKDRFVQACVRMTKIRNVSAFRHIDWNDDQQIFTDVLMEYLAKECSKPEIIELI